MAKRKKTDRDLLNGARDVLLEAVDGDANSNEEAIKIAIAVLTRDYTNDVKSVGDDLIRRIKDGEIKDREGFDEALRQDIEGTQRIIYTFQARCGVLVCEYPDRYEEEFGEKPAGPEQQLFMSMELEVTEYVEREVGDLDDFIAEQSGDED